MGVVTIDSGKDLTYANPAIFRMAGITGLDEALNEESLKAALYSSEMELYQSISKQAIISGHLMTPELRPKAEIQN